MRGLLLGVALSCVASGALAQVMTNCNQMGMFTNCTSTGPGGMQTTDCSKVGGFLNCNTTGNAYAEQPASSGSSSSGDGSGAAVAGVAAGAALGLLIWKGAEAVHQHRTEDRAKRVATLMLSHDCTGAVALAEREHDHAMAARVPGLCKTQAQTGEEPAYLAEEAAPDVVGSWAKVNLRFGAGGRVIGANRDVVDVLQSSSAPPGSIWVHEEALSEAGKQQLGGRSELLLVAFDCLHSRFSIAATTKYAGQNMTGESGSVDAPTPALALRPGSKAEAWARYACVIANDSGAAQPTPVALSH